LTNVFLPLFWNSKPGKDESYFDSDAIP
jgi:hypothetical protein